MQLSNEKLLEFYHLMVKIRAFEETLSSLFSKGLLGGTWTSRRRMICSTLN